MNRTAAALASILWGFCAVFSAQTSAFTASSPPSSPLPSSNAANVSLPVNDDYVALVVGNNNYLRQPVLNNAIRDAAAIAEKLRGLGFKVTLRENMSRLELLEEVRALVRVLQERPNAHGLFYFAGHGISVDNRNYLVGIEAYLKTVQAVPDEAIDVQRIVDDMAQTKNAMNFIILDACRDNPLAIGHQRSIMQQQPGSALLKGGLAAMSVPSVTRGFLIAFATGPGQRASDGPVNGHGLYTERLLQFIDLPGVEANAVFQKVQEAVSRDTRGAQKPWLTSSPVGGFSFRPAIPGPSAPMPPGSEANPPTSTERLVDSKDKIIWDTLKDTKSIEELESFLRDFSSSPFVDPARRKRNSLVSERRTQVEDDWWANTDRNNVGSLKAYLFNYPRGIYQKFAEQRLKKLLESMQPLPPEPALPPSNKSPPGSDPRKVEPPVAAPHQTQNLAVLPSADGHWTGMINRERFEFSDRHNCRSASIELDVIGGKITAGKVTLDDKRQFDVELTKADGARINMSGHLPSQGPIKDVVIRFYDFLNNNFANYRFAGEIFGNTLAGEWRAEGMQCGGKFTFTRVQSQG